MRASLYLLPMFMWSQLSAQTEGTCIPTGGRAALDRLFEQELHYPDVALEAGIKGEVVIGTLVGPNGSTREVRVARSLSPECDAEALRVIRLVCWQPATAGELCSGKEELLAVPFDPGRYKRWVKGRHTHAGGLFDLPADSTLDVLSAKQLDQQVTPDIPGGMQGLPVFLSKELRYPEQAYRYSLEGTVRLEFVVEASGNLSNMVALDEVGGGCIEEAMRLMHRMAWKPGLRNGKRVRSRLQVSIQFKLPKQGR